MTRPDAPVRDTGRGAPDRSVHASAVAIGGRGLLILGPSRSGKSRLALALVAASSPARPIVLIGDDRILLSRRGDGVVARPHPRIAGFIERRGLGIVACPHAERAPVAAVVELGHPPPAGGTSARDVGDLPSLAVARVDDAREAGARVLRWWRGLRSATRKA